MKNWKDLKAFAEHNKFFVTSTTGGQHNINSKHALGLAIDIRTRDKENAEIDTFIAKCRAIGVRVRDERIRPLNQKVWSGAHLHLEITAETLTKLVGFQKRNHLKPDGIAGKITFAALDAILS